MASSPGSEFAGAAVFHLGYNDWGLSRDNPSCLGMGGDVGGNQVKDSMISLHPSDMIAVADVRSDAAKPVQIQFSANTTPPTDWTQGQDPTWHPQVPCNRHNYRTDVLFADGHVEEPLRSDVINPNNNDVAVALEQRQSAASGKRLDGARQLWPA